jgi:glycosyltransferase involved in cell wall biosynthesis
LRKRSFYAILKPVRMPPKVSIITATYNRANVLRFTIESVLRSTFEEWEMLVIGDACTDDTAEVVASFGDPRIRFINLPENSGEQATPNNEGVRRARGELIAFLNHDDLWTPDHLALCVEALQTTDAELVSTITIAIGGDDVPWLAGLGPHGAYEPHVVAPASSWVFRRALADAVGPWRPAREIFAAPSQDWLFRAWKQRHRLHTIAKATVIAMHSGGRARSYADRLETENARYAALLRDDPEFIPRIMADIATRWTARGMRIDIVAPLVRVAKNIVCRALIALRMHPDALRLAMRYRRRGAFLDQLRKTRGLPPLPRPGVSPV